jgi:(E)-4-hydroxy-3-methylbut-2-enyl-diphosphate synthase
MIYCASRFRTVRRPAVEVSVGAVGVGGANPIRVQSMTTSDTQNVAATVRQCIALAEVGCEIVRVTAPNVAAAKCLQAIRAQLTAAGFPRVPLVADIHFLPAAAMEALEHVEKVRVNPGNYADKKKFAVRDYTDADYDRELSRLHEALTPLVLRAKALGRSLRIGTNHGSLSDRIMNRFGDTPLGMVESALEFVRICESHGFYQLVLSMKASNPKVMIQAYRLLAARMDAAHRAYPLHLGVTEAGDGEDGRIKSAIGIGSLLLDGLGDTIRVSLTEDSVYEIPVARALAEKAMSLWKGRAEPLSTPSIAANSASPPDVKADGMDPFHYTKRETASIAFGAGCLVGPEQPPRVIVRGTPAELSQLKSKVQSSKYTDTPLEGALVPVATLPELDAVLTFADAADFPASFVALDLAPTISPRDLEPKIGNKKLKFLFVRTFTEDESDTLRAFAALACRHSHFLVCAVTPAALSALGETLRVLGEERLIFTLDREPSELDSAAHVVGRYRQLADQLRALSSRAPLWIRNTAVTAIGQSPDFLSRLLDAAILTGALLCDGLGDLVSVETEADPARATTLTYNLLQGAGTRSSKTEFVACPSCGRTLFDLQTTTQRIRARTGHLKGVKIAIMGCIVNGPGEMADADFGYVGGAPGKINLYVGKTCVQYNVPQAEADARLVALIREHGKWVEPIVGRADAAQISAAPARNSAAAATS